MHTKTKSIPPAVDTVDRSSAGTARAPTVPADGEERHHCVAVHDGALDRPLTSLELVRQLENLVRELFAITTRAD
jgi:hypothetical protein